MVKNQMEDKDPDEELLEKAWHTLNKALVTNDDERIPLIIEAMNLVNDVQFNLKHGKKIKSEGGNTQ